MIEQVCKYMAENARIFCVSLADAVDKSAELNGLQGEDRSILGRLEAFACCIAALQKDERASVSLRMSLVGKGIFSATADRNGLIRGRKEGDCDGIEDLLDVTLQLPLRGNYTGVVTGCGFDDLVSGYFSNSLQIASSCRVLATERGFFCILSEQLPGVNCDLEDLCALACETLPQEIVPESFVFLESYPFSFGCTCSRAALMRFVSALSEEDREELSENGKIVTYCNACGKKYTFEI